jgi:hypothetical protein
LAIALETWTLTVFSLMNSWSPISRLVDRPRPADDVALASGQAGPEAGPGGLQPTRALGPLESRPQPGSAGDDLDRLDERPRADLASALERRREGTLRLQPTARRQERLA